MRIKDQIAQEAAKIRQQAKLSGFSEHGEPLMVVPFVSKKCIVYCGAGRCNCHPTVGHHFCLVFESLLKRSSEDFVSEIKYLQSQVPLCEQQSHEYSEADQTLDDTHISLRLSRPG